MKSRFVFPRELLLVELERRCAGAACGARVRLAVTKAEARAYTGFECERCGLWNDDALSERDIPEWWEELKITSLDGVRPAHAEGGGGGETAGAIERLSDAWWRLKAERRRSGEEPEDELSGGGPEEF